MQLYVGVTDNDWFDFLHGLGPDEVNFWRPGGQAFRALSPGEPFLFKLKAPLTRLVDDLPKCEDLYALPSLRTPSRRWRYILCRPPWYDSSALLSPSVPHG